MGLSSSTGLAQPVNLPYLAANYSFFDPQFSGLPPLSNNVRSLVFNAPVVDLLNDTNYFASDIPVGTATTVLDWPAAMNTHDSRPPTQPLGDTIEASVDAYSVVSVNACPPSESFPGETLNQILVGALNPSISYSVTDVQVQMAVKGGTLGGNTVRLNGKVAYGYSVADGPMFNDPQGEDKAVTGDLILAIDWGVDPSGTRNCVLVEFQSQTDVNSTDTSVLPLGTVLSDLGVPDPVAHVTNIHSAILSQITSGALHLQGAIPELVYLYDFSGSNTIPVNSALGTSFAEDYQPWTNLYPLINQYDAGVTFSLPTQFSNPAPDHTGYTPGGNACGPTSLSMALLAYQIANSHPLTSADLVSTIYSNTMLYGFVSSPPNFDNKFNWIRAKNWLDGGSYNSLPFTSGSPLPAGAMTSFILDTNATRFPADWAVIDGWLTRSKQPVLLRTDLGLGNGLAPNPVGGGHVILLLGKGHSDQVGNAYGLSGNYYIVADPAGHFFADINSASSRHYGRVQNLMSGASGINYGGWFAIYPSELLQESIINQGTKLPEIRALTLFSSVPYQQIQVQCPVALLVTDPMGRQTGIQTNGVVVENIPQSFYQPEVADGEEDSDTLYITNGVKTVIINNPIMGGYQFQLTGTGTGSYTLNAIDVGSGSQNVLATNVSGSTAPGSETNISFASTLGLPALQPTLQNRLLTLSWPSLATNFQLQTTTNLTLTNSWTSVTNIVKLSGAQNIVSNLVLTNPPRFFRLKN